MQRIRNITFFVIILFVAIFSIYLERKNTLRVDDDIDCTKLDKILFEKLAILVNENNFNRQYYEVILSYNAGCNCSYVLNYNTEYQILSISSDPCSGFSRYAKVSRKDLFKIVNSNIKIENFYQFYKNEYPKDYGIIQTRACNPSFLDLFFD